MGNIWEISIAEYFTLESKNIKQFEEAIKTANFSAFRKMFWQRYEEQENSLIGLA